MLPGRKLYLIIDDHLTFGGLDTRPILGSPGVYYGMWQAFERPFMMTNKPPTTPKPILNATPGTSLALPIHPPPHPHPRRTNPPDPNSSKRIVPSHTNPAGRELRTSYTMIHKTGRVSWVMLKIENSVRCRRSEIKGDGKGRRTGLKDVRDGRFKKGEHSADVFRMDGSIDGRNEAAR